MKFLIVFPFLAKVTLPYLKLPAVFVELPCHLESAYAAHGIATARESKT
jgi:hypothetical protein